MTLRRGETAYTASYALGPTGPSLIDLRLTAGAGSVITSDVLRRVPLGDLYAAAVAAVQADGSGDCDALPQRFRTEQDYRRLLHRYHALIRSGDRRPLHTLAAAMSTTHNTAAARVKTARRRLNDTQGEAS